MTDPIAAKRLLRARVRAERRARPAEERAAADTAIGDRLLALARGRACVACYLSAPSEPGTRSFLRRAEEEGIRVILPVPRDDGSLGWVPSAGSRERRGAWGVPEPVGDALPPSALAEAGLVIAPAAAADGSGGRLGWGGGFYDRALAALPSPRPVWAVLYDSEVVDRVPRETHDMRVTGIVTATRTLPSDR
ncbi:5-formyltetrahydrofolate cyclo-ligase [Microbacterium sp. gxy059]|uniref:5-formyltetrahydrofolate cyclo-ligase n=1 Tax=Microbacterium sp. gxy059 TaxID=2957199 RepID=UPI003D96BE90